MLASPRKAMQSAVRCASASRSEREYACSASLRALNAPSSSNSLPT
jgi:hypothetical protein